jgi:DNA recombination protein RmuC
MILERALELSGLKKGVEFDTQVSLSDDDGRRQIPDVIVLFR